MVWLWSTTGRCPRSSCTASWSSCRRTPRPKRYSSSWGEMHALNGRNRASLRALGRNDRYYPLQTAALTLRLDEVHAIATGRRVARRGDRQRRGCAAPRPQRTARRRAELRGPRRAARRSAWDRRCRRIAAKGDNGIGIVGVAPDAALMALRACWKVDASGATLCSSFTLAKAVQYALRHQAQVLNFSLSGPPDLLLERLLDRALAQGVAIVAAVDPDAGDAGFPASHPLVSRAAQGARGPSARSPCTGAADANSPCCSRPGTTSSPPHRGWVGVHVRRLPGRRTRERCRRPPAGTLAQPEAAATPRIARAKRRADRSRRPSALDACAALAQVTPPPGCACCRATAGKNPRPPAAKRPS